ncbi:MAG: hypothetical protein OXI35_04270 [Gemmatimonadota bacterium]|nr:hypothetical protein [Gemmatimonadota bacterium]
MFDHIWAGNRNELLGRLIAYTNSVTMEFSRLEMPTNKALIESCTEAIGTNV